MENRTNVIPRTFDRVGAILEELGYVEGERLTGKGKTLTKIYAESDLLLTEMLRDEVISGVSAADLVALLSGFVYEGRGERSKIPRLPRAVDPLVGRTVSIWAKLVDIEGDHGLPPQREPNFDLAWSSHRWANGNSLNSILRESEITVGDFVRLMRQVIDLLGQVAEAEPSLAKLVREAMARVDRGVVAYSAVVA